MIRVSFPLALLFSGLLAACGGGGGDGGAAPAAAVSAATFPNVLTNYQARIRTGGTDDFTITGTCGAGTARITSSATSPVTVDGQPAYAASRSVSESVPGCQPPSRSESSTVYYNTDYTQIAQFIVFGRFDKSSGNPPPSRLPASVRVGDKGTYSTMTSYSDGNMTTVIGSRVLSYEVFADTASTALLGLFDQSYDTAGQLQFTQLSRYRIAADGQQTLIDITLRYANGTQLSYTKI